ncbi:MAG: cytochrome c [Hyphomicrobiales bacterium]|nr:cytochrome c [Hyphomicrobiales bacterium]MCP5000737.1 cytochrome c [Hyphomicrobiales bacterium]
MNKLCWGISGLMALVLLVVVYVFVIQGRFAETDDGRTVIQLSSSERDFVLAEMRGFLESVETITLGLKTQDMKSIAASAQKMGMANAASTPVALMAKLPADFRALGMATHEAFDALAVEAQDMGDAQVILGELADLLGNCTSCHAGYRFDVATAGVK